MIPKSEFVRRILEVSVKSGYSFLTPDGLKVPERVSERNRFIASLITGVGFCLAGGGAIGAAIAGAGVGQTFGKLENEKIAKALRRLSEYCDIAGIHLKNGLSMLRLIIDADTLSDSEIIGRSLLIQERASDFKEFSMNSVGGRNMGTLAQMVLLYTDHARAAQFSKVAKKCKHRSWGGVTTCPLVADLEAETVTLFQFDPFGQIAKDAATAMQR